VFNKLNQLIQEIAIKRARPLAVSMLPLFPEKVGSILDFGSGLGHIGLMVSEYTGNPVVYVDVRQYPSTHPDIHITKFDGKVLPYDDGEFNLIMANFVLHHVPSPRNSLREIKRVSRRFIVIAEDLVKSRKEIRLEIIKDTIANFFIPHMTLQYKLESDWESLFSELGLSINKKIFFEDRYIFKFKHIAWLLEIQPSRSEKDS
jgi:ubiquinone/menaquinone biosynthesis C-methylase UbiE